MRRFVFSAVDSGERVSGTAKQTHLERSLDFRSTRVVAGQVLDFAREVDASGDVTYRASLPDGRSYCVGDRDLLKRFTLGDAPPAWRVLHPGRLVAFPARADDLRRRAQAAGIDQILTWKFQWDDCIEMAMSRGDLNSFVMGLGKSRMAISLCLLGGRSNAIVVPAHLVDEIADELRASHLSPDCWQVLTRHDQPLRRINLVAITRLRAPVCRGAGRRTLARCLRGRFHTVVVDEAHSLKATRTLQTAAIWQLSARRRYACTGSLVNYPRDALQVVRWTSGDGTARQPYGVHEPYLEARLATSTAYCERGVDRFADDVVVTEWVTSEFADDLQSGAAREVPRIRSPERYREWLSKAGLKRRLREEPEVAAFVHTPSHSTRLVECPWDADHLALYTRVAREFAAWYRQMKSNADADGRHINLIAILARIQAVVAAANAPHREIGKDGLYHPLTSKQRAALSDVVRWTAEGRKSVLFATQPDVLDRMYRELTKRDIEAVAFHGGIPIATRTRQLNQRFRKGPAPVLLASIGAAQTGLNLPMASRAGFLSRDWSAIAEAQCLGRLLRPQQTEHVEGSFYMLPGSIDAYMHQLTSFKSDAALVGIDNAESEIDGVEFEHLDTILGRFVKDLEEGALAA